METTLDYVNENKSFLNEILAQLMRVLLFYHVLERHHHMETYLFAVKSTDICFHLIFRLLGEL